MHACPEITRIKEISTVTVIELFDLCWI